MQLEEDGPSQGRETRSLATGFRQRDSNQLPTTKKGIWGNSCLAKVALRWLDAVRWHCSTCLPRLCNCFQTQRQMTILISAEYVGFCQLIIHGRILSLYRDKCLLLNYPLQLLTFAKVPVNPYVRFGNACAKNSRSISKVCPESSWRWLPGTGQQPDNKSKEIHAGIDRNKTPVA